MSKSTLVRLAFVMMGAVILIAAYNSYRDQEADRKQKAISFARAAKIKNFQDKFAASSSDRSKGATSVNSDVCFALGNWQSLQNFTKELSDAGLSLAAIDRVNEFEVVSRDRAIDLSRMVAYSKGIPDCGGVSGVDLVEEAIDAVSLGTFSFAENATILGDLRKVLVREITPAVKEAVTFLQNGRQGARPDFRWLADEIWQHHLSAKELGIRKFQLEKLLLFGSRSLRDPIQ